MQNKIKQFIEDGSFYLLGITAIIMFIGAMLGSLYATYEVLHNEQTDTGRYAVYEKCIRYVEYTYSDGEGGGKCVEYENIAVPLGQRLIQQIKHYSFLGAVLFFGPGMIFGTIRWNKRNRNKLNKTY